MSDEFGLRQILPDAVRTKTRAPVRLTKQDHQKRIGFGHVCRVFRMAQRA